MHPTSMILVPDFQDQSKLFIFRNVTDSDLIVKVVTSNKAMRFEGTAFVVRSRSYFENQLTISAAMKEGATASIKIYARPILASNIGTLKEWVESDTVKKSSLAFKLNVKVTYSLFSAGKIILDLPGSASLFEFELDAKNVLDDEVDTANCYDQVDATKTRVGRRKNTAEEVKNCEFVRNFIEAIFPPPAAVRAHSPLNAS